jgi:hypothetical protein
MDRSDSTKNVALHIVEKQLPVDQLIMILYNSPVQATYNHFKSVNYFLQKIRSNVLSKRWSF